MTGLTAGLAGCGYAHGGGDIRAESRTAGGGRTQINDTVFETTDEQIAVLNSGYQFVSTGDEREYTEAATVTVTDREGEQLWTFTHLTPGTDLAFGDRAYVLDERGRLVASQPPPSASGRDVTVDEAWQLELETDPVQMVAGQDAVFVAATDRLLAVRNGTISWERSVPEQVETLHATDGVVIASTATTTVAFGPDGERRWRRRLDSEFSMRSLDDRLLIWGNRTDSTIDGDDVACLDSADGEIRWSRSVPGTVSHVGLSNDRVALSTGGRLFVHDVATGEHQWDRLESSLGGSIVLGPEAVYTVSPDCETLAVDSDGRRWTRSLELRNCAVIDGWIDDDTVAFLFESGDIVWLQRTDETTGLLW